MKLFLDTSSDKIILGLINNKKVVCLEKHDSNKKAVKNTNLFLHSFLLKNNLKILDLEAIYFLSGPGSFTGMRVSFLIASTIKMIKKDIKVFEIDSLSVQKQNKINPVIKISKNNYYFLKKNFLFVEKIVYSKKKPKLKNISLNFEKFNKETLEKNLNKFKEVDFNKFELNYINSLY